jgi:hypothetical protein
MYLVVFMVSVLELYYLYMCIQWCSWLVLWRCTTCTYVFSGVHGYCDGAVLHVHMYLVVFMVSVMALYYLYICI